MLAEKLLLRLDKVKHVPGKHAGNWKACCPAHDDSDPSLAVAETADGRVLVHCWAGCSALDVISAAGLEWNDLFPEKLERPERRYAPRSEMDRVIDEFCRVVKDSDVDELVMLYCKLTRQEGGKLTDADVQRERAAFDRIRRRAA